MSGELSKEHIWRPSEQDLQREIAWIEEQIGTIGRDKLIETITAAEKVRSNAYQPYSNYSVGAAVLCVSGDIYSACNAETVTYTETDHAERATISKAISEGEIQKSGRKFIRALVVSHSGKSGPCGGCRQRIAEHCDNAVIIDVDGEGNIKNITSLKILFPYAFAPAHLEKE